MSLEESELDIAGLTAGSYWALYPPPGTIIKQCTGCSRYIFSSSRWLNFESDPSGPTSALSDEPSIQIGQPPGAEKCMAKGRQGHGRTGDSRIIIASYRTSPLVKPTGPRPHSTLLPPSSTTQARPDARHCPSRPSSATN